MALENQLFAPTLKGVIDFFRTLQGKGHTKKVNILPLVLELALSLIIRYVLKKKNANKKT